MAEPAPPPVNDAIPARYHHGALKPALLAAAETILKREGIEGLTLRAAAREAGVSHAAPKNHFDDVRGLLSELAAVGYVRFGDALLAEIEANRGKMSAQDATGLGYVKFAAANSQLFTLMFRSERLDFERPALKAASQAAFAMLSGNAGDGSNQPALTIGQAAQIAAKWSLVHGFACLMLDRRLGPLLRITDGQLDELALIQAIMKGPPQS